jgi:membrane protein involved in colicin uptake
MLQRARLLWQENRAGFTGSVLLHLLFLAVILWWGLNHPVMRQPPLKAMLVDIVTVPTNVPGPSGGAATPLRAPVPAAPKKEGVKPKAETPAPDELESRITQMAQLRAPDTALPAPDNGAGAGNGTGGGGNYALADFVRAQILRRWWPQLENDAARGMPVAIKLKLSRAGVISDVEIVDQQRFINDKIFRNMALSARNAALLASPIALPPGRYDAVMDISLTLDPKAVLH